MEGADVTLFNAMDTSQLSNDRETISQCKSNLDILRSHLARHHTEAEADSLDVANLDDDTAIVIADFKNNILDCMFRENMVKFFGKNGTNDLGFMRIIKGSDSSELEATFYHFVSNDKLKDTQFVLSAKYELYTKHMPAHIKNVQYRSDGAANLACTLHYLLQPMWKIWTGINEEICKHCPAGEGKSELDGNFGQMSQVLTNKHDLGYDYNTAETIVTALTQDGCGLAGTTFGVFLPGRSHILEGKFESDVCGKAVLRSTLQSDGSLVTRQHTGYGTGTPIYQNLSIVKIKVGSGKKMSPISYFDGRNKRTTFTIFGNLLSEFCGTEQSYAFNMGWKWGERQLIIAALASFAPIAKEYTPSSTQRTSLITKLHGNSTGMGNEHTRQDHRVSRKRRKKEQIEYDLEAHRATLLTNGIYSCRRKCPITNRYCRKQFLRSGNLDVHETRNKCVFPTGISARDRIVYAASQPGGSLAAGKHYNRGKNTGLFKDVVATPIGTRGSENAKCFGKFHRPPDKKTYYKPKKLQEVLKVLFAERPVLSAEMAHKKMTLMKDTDGSALFDYSKRGEVSIFPQKSQEYKKWNGCSMCQMKPCSKCTGKLISPEEIKSHFSSLAKARKDAASKIAEERIDIHLPTNNNPRPTAPLNVPPTNEKTTLMMLLLPTLKFMCRERLLIISGRKAELVDRIITYDDLQTQEGANDNSVSL